MILANLEEWQLFFNTHPEAHILQSAQWGILKQSFGWEMKYLIQNQVGALLLLKKLPFGFTVAYIPKGPVGKNWDELWPLVDNVCKKNKSIFLKVEPDIWDDKFTNNNNLLNNKFLQSDIKVQPRSTIVVDLKNSEEKILQHMKQKTRYNIRLAIKKNVEVVSSNDIQLFWELLQSTSARDDFPVHSKMYYQKAFDLFKAYGNCELLIAYYQDKPLAGLIVFTSGNRAWYFYGASNDIERNRMPTYLLQWEAIRWAKSKGCISYDLWGIPDEAPDFLEENFMNRSDGLWGVYRFKRGFGGEIRKSIGAWDRIYYPIIYQGFQLLIKTRKNLVAS